ncbi:hypothetical protein QJS04_geneDACA001293 [Acorus gramineus]|uniref:PRONE domain-containing protein n=1 Tax=Acorus gramineus TaxID=55184 RepID=A0AAV9AAX0_ACOGR|nr:hypothetical protein QJS04_geneDACA001293 [Acorus gramineus]
MESLDFNIMARTDDLIYVDAALKRNAKPFSIHHNPYIIQFATLTFCSSTPVSGSSTRELHSLIKGRQRGQKDAKLEMLLVPNMRRIWSYQENLSSRRARGDTPERD